MFTLVRWGTPVVQRELRAEQPELVSHDNITIPDSAMQHSVWTDSPR